MIFSPTSSAFRKWGAVFLLVVFCTTGLFGAPFTAQAQEADTDPYYDGPTFDELFEKYAEQCAKTALLDIIISAVLSFAFTQVPTLDWADKIKELIKDCLVSATKSALLELITGQAVGFTQRGYGGNPSFVQNIGQYLATIADNVAGNYIAQTAAGEFLCSPFRADIQLALTQYYQERSGRLFPYGQSSCTLTGIASNVDAFLGGDFYAGGWNAWIELVSNPYNNPYGAYLETTAELDRQIANEVDQAEQKLAFSSGFLDKEKQTCYLVTQDVGDDGIISYSGEELPDDFVGPPPPGSTIECDPPQTITPGDTIKTSMEQAFGAKLDSIIAADEINEIISLVAAYLLTDILTKDEGLESYDYTAQFDQPLVVVEDWNEYPDPGGGGGGGTCLPEPWEIWENSPDAKPANRVERVALSSFTATEAEPSIRMDIDVGAKLLYTRMHAEFDLTTDADPYDAGPLQYNVFWMHRSPDKTIWHANDVSEVVASKLRYNNLRFSTSINLNTGCAAQQGRGDMGFALKGNTTYHVTVDYNTKTRKRSVFIDGPGSDDGYVQDSTTVDALQSSNPMGKSAQGGFFIILGGKGNPDGAEGSTAGWKWSNFNLTLEP